MKCANCKGHGWVHPSYTVCPYCHGKGKLFPRFFGDDETVHQAGIDLAGCILALAVFAAVVFCGLFL